MKKFVYKIQQKKKKKKKSRKKYSNVKKSSSLVHLWTKVQQKVCTVVEKSVVKDMYSCGKKCGERYVQLWKKVW